MEMNQTVCECRNIFKKGQCIQMMILDTVELFANLNPFEFYIKTLC